MKYTMSGTGRGYESTLAFAPLVFNDWTDLGVQVERRAKDAQEILYDQDERPEWVYFIEKGVVKLVRMESDGAELILGLRADGWLLNASAVVLNERSQCSAVCLTPCVVRRISRAAFTKLMESNPSLMLNLTKLICREVRSEEEQQIELRSRSAQSRLDRLRAELSGVDGDVSSSLNFLGLKQLEIAQLLSITPEHLSRLFNRCGYTLAGHSKPAAKVEMKQRTTGSRVWGA